MLIIANLLIIIAFIASISTAGTSIVLVLKKTTKALPVIRVAWSVTVLCITLASAILAFAFLKDDFSFRYVVNNSEVNLSIFYKLTSFWSGQEGSLLFWALCTALFGFIFTISASYKKLDDKLKLGFWVFYPTIMAFFMFLIAVYLNPFTEQATLTMDGRGLSPLLRHPGMIFHPPLLFMGYSAFFAPVCLALSSALMSTDKEHKNWLAPSLSFVRISWMLLSAGIILGAWWAYMVLGWGGYWAWDPVENASLVPWLIATAFLHTAQIQLKANKLKRFNILLISLVCIFAFFATLITRSNFIRSVHGYPDGGVALPLTIFLGIFLIISIILSITSKDKGERNIPLNSRQGLLFILSWLLLALAALVSIATIWPLISSIWSDLPQAFDAKFYNKTCLPLFVFACVLLVICPWFSWTKGFKNPLAGVLSALLLIILIPVSVLLMEGMPDKNVSFIDHMANALPLAQLACAAAITSSIGLILTLIIGYIKKSKNGLSRRKLAFCIIHLGFAFMVLGVAFSGPYKEDHQVSLAVGAKAKAGDYEVKLDKLLFGEMDDYIYFKTKIDLMQDNKLLGSMFPERRVYHKYQDPFSEPYSIGGFGDEVYINLLTIDPKTNSINIQVTINSLVSWIWLGGILLCLGPIFLLFRKDRAVGKSPDNNSEIVPKLDVVPKLELDNKSAVNSK